MFFIVITFLEKNNIDGLDLVYILLGSNGWMSEPHEGLTDEEYARIHADNGRKLVDLIHKASPNAKIKVFKDLVASNDDLLEEKCFDVMKGLHIEIC